VPRYLCSRASSSFVLFSWAGAGRLGILVGGGGCDPRSVVRVEGGRGEDGQVILVGPELVRFPGVWEDIGIQFGVAEPLFELRVLERAVDGGVAVLLR